jgi:hypothetical protein
MPRKPPRRLFRDRPSPAEVAAATCRAIPRDLADIKRCTLCGKPATYLGVWCPTARYQEQLGATPGKDLVAVYGVCERCRKRPGWMTAVEDNFLAEAAAELRVN